MTGVLREAPATVAGLYATPCDPLFLAVRGDGRPLHGLTGHVDWRLGARLSDLVRGGQLDGDQPLLVPATPLLPVGRLILWRASAATLDGLARMARDLRAGVGPDPRAAAGFAPADFGATVPQARTAFGDLALVVYT